MNTKTRRTSLLAQDSRGMVAIMITIVIMIVISLIVVGFTKVIRREQRQALDRQLSTQAFYAAEAGVNQIREQIPAILTADPSYEKTTCGDDAQISNVQLDTSTGVVVTCTLVDPSPPSLIYGSINHESKIVPIISADPTDEIERITLTWRDDAGRPESFTTPGNCNNHFAGPNRFPSSGWNCTVGVLRIDLVPTQGTISRAGLQANAFTAFLYPGSGGSANMTYGSASGNAQGETVRTVCTPGTPAECKMDIDTSALNSNSFHLRMRTLYGASNVTIEAGSSAGSNYELTGAQALIDVTGKANDILRRIQVRVASSDLSRQNLPDFAIQGSNDICKRFRVIPNQSFVESDCPADPY